MTIELDPETILVAYRGTDGSMVGLNEDVDMSYQPEIFGQSVAADYLDRIAQTYPDKKYTPLVTKRRKFCSLCIIRSITEYSGSSNQSLQFLTVLVS